jgi:DNA-binding response OmpR family regulator
MRQAGGLTLDPSRREIRLAEGETVSLTPLENRLLDYLMLNAGHVLTTEAIINHVWGHEGGDRDMVRQLIRRLRLKIAQACTAGADQPDATGSVYIETVPGLGYGLNLVPPVD